MGKIKTFFHNLTKKQIIISSSVLAVIVLCAASGIVYYNYQMELKRVEAQKAEALRLEALKQDAADIELEEKEEEPEVIEVVQQIKNISFSGTSIEKDLKIKIVDEASALVSGTAFKITVYPEGAENKAKDYTDEDMDGIIHIKDLAGGKYIVKLQDIEGFAVLQNPITVKVKEKIEYVKVDVKAEIKKEEELDAEAEDAEAGKTERVEVSEKVEDTTSNIIPEVKPDDDSLPLLESTVTAAMVEKDKVSTANFTTAAVSETTKEDTIGQTTIRIPESVTLYDQGTEASKSCKMTLEVITDVTREMTIQKMEWSIDKPDVASLTVDSDTEAAVLALQKGNAIISILITYLNEEGLEQTKTLQSNVLVGDFTDDATQLLDMDGNGLYLDGEAKQIATLKDYSTTDVFYGLPKYTGWQVIDEKTYYFDENNQPVKGEQKIGNFHYKFDENGVLVDTAEKKGIDVSKWQENINWEAVADAGIDFAIIRVGYRGIKTGVMVEDPYFKANIAGATKAGIKVGVYFYSQALTEAEAIEEASMAIELVKGYHLDYPIFIDIEGSGGQADKLSKDARTKIAKAFCETVKNAGYKPGVYANKHWFETKLYADQLDSYMIWVAQYSSKCTYSGKYDMWQYTESGTVNGVKWKVDLNICYKGL